MDVNNSSDEKLYEESLRIVALILAYAVASQVSKMRYYNLRYFFSVQGIEMKIKHILFVREIIDQLRRDFDLPISHAKPKNSRRHSFLCVEDRFLLEKRLREHGKNIKHLFVVEQRSRLL